MCHINSRERSSACFTACSRRRTRPHLLACHHLFSKQWRCSSASMSRPTCRVSRQLPSSDAPPKCLCYHQRSCLPTSQLVPVSIIRSLLTLSMPARAPNPQRRGGGWKAWTHHCLGERRPLGSQSIFKSHLAWFLVTLAQVATCFDWPSIERRSPAESAAAARLPRCIMG